MTIASYIKSERLAGRFPRMPIDGAVDTFWLCDGNWHRIDDSKNWFDTKDQAMTYRFKMLEKKVKYEY